MSILVSNYEKLSYKDGFNGSVRHIKSTIALIDKVAERKNLADELNQAIDEKSIEREDSKPIVTLVLSQKYRYAAEGRNLIGTADNLQAICSIVATWNAVDLVVVYSHPDLGALVINPKNPRHIAQIDRLNRSELVVVFAGRFAKEIDAVDKTICWKACEALLDLFCGLKPKIDSALLKGDCSYVTETEKGPSRRGRPKLATSAQIETSAPGTKTGTGKIGSQAVRAKGILVTKSNQEEKAPAIPQKAAVAAEAAVKPGARMTPQYSVLVTNELFHNGNVEAWKRIISSFRAKHSDLQVLVYYDGEHISDINALFKWGKVKHGSTIQFAVAGENITDVAKLQRYLAQGASHLFEAFLKGPVNSVMQLF